MLASSTAVQDFGTQSVFDTTEVGKGKPYTILYNEERVIGTSEIGDTANIPNRLGTRHPFRVFVTNLRRVEVTDAVNSDGLNNIYITAISNRTNASGFAPLINYNWRLDFKDV